jgi:hypothetical protein
MIYLQQLMNRHWITIGAFKDRVIAYLHEKELESHYPDAVFRLQYANARRAGRQRAKNGQG